MDQIISEYFSSVGDYRNFNLVFDIEPSFIKFKKKILFLETAVFHQKTHLSGVITTNIIQNNKIEGTKIGKYKNQKISEKYYRDGKEEGSGAYGEAGLWIFWWVNGQKQLERNYRNGKLIG